MPTSLPSSADPAQIDFQAILKRCGGDSKFASALVKRFRNQAGNDVAKMERLLTAGDADGLALAAHSMKSTTAYVSAIAASAISKQIEALAQDRKLNDIAPLLVALGEEIRKAEAWFARNATAA